MSGVRALEASDVPAVTALHRRVFGGREAPGGSRGDDGDGLEEFLTAILLEHPWHDPELPSLVYEHRRRLVGFLGIMPRPMMLEGRRLRAIVSHDFMVDPGSRSTLAALHLSRAAFGLPHDILLADGNDASRAIWERAGGTTSLSHSLRWRRLLSPARCLLPGLGNGGPLGRALRPLVAGVDGIARRRAPSLFGLPSCGDTGLPIGAGELLECTRRAAGERALRPVYDRPALAWLLARLAGRSGPVELRGVLVREAGGEPLGWYLCIVRAGGIAEVVQAVAFAGRLERVLAHLFLDAWSRGAIGVSGRVDPLRIRELSAAGCLFDGGRSWLLVHAPDPGITAAIHSGDVFLTRLECEGWIRLAHVGGC